MRSTTQTPSVGSFEHFEARLHSITDTNKKAREFEEMCRQLLLRSPEYRHQVKHAWLWYDWPDRWGRDKGSDIIVETVSGDIWAVQAKAYRNDRTIPRKEIDSFLTDSNRHVVSYRLLIATTDKIARSGREDIEGQEKPVGLILRADLADLQISWPEKSTGTPTLVPRHTRRRDQTRAVNRVISGFRSHDRGQLILPCGTGKTLIALWVSESLKCRRTLVLVPTLALISQTLKEWSGHSRKPFNYMVVCSSEATVDEAALGTTAQSTTELGVPVTTDPGEICRFLRRRSDSRGKVVFCTYHSSDCIETAQQQTGVPHFDLVIADEAHRCVGDPKGLFTTVLDGKKIKARKRLFMTATPRFLRQSAKRVADQRQLEIASMDNEAHFGPEFHQMTFAQAIKDELLSDYRLVVIGVTDSKCRQWAEEGRLVRDDRGKVTDARTWATQIGLVKAVQQYDLSRLISFHSSIAKAKRFVDETHPGSFPDVFHHELQTKRNGKSLWCGHISSRVPVRLRRSQLKHLGNLPPQTLGLISNCSCLNEGVNLPILDGIVFVDPKQSVINIVQAVGRVLRLTDQKTVGTIVVPVFVDDTEDPDAVLSSSAFEPVWSILRALRSLDTRLADYLDGLRTSLGKRIVPSTSIRLPDNIIIDLPVDLGDEFTSSFYARSVETTTRKPNLTYDLILEAADDHFDHFGRYPHASSGPVNLLDGETWSGIHSCLMRGFRGLPGGISLADLLDQSDRIRHKHKRVNFTKDQILEWITRFHDKTGEWPTRASGAINTGHEDTWTILDQALRKGIRGLSGDSSLSLFLLEFFNVKHRLHPQLLTLSLILKWADAWFNKHNQWPKSNDGTIPDSDDGTWLAVNHALQRGTRGLSPGGSLAQLLSQERNYRNQARLAKLTFQQIVLWAEEHIDATGERPTRTSGEIPSAPGEKWLNIEASLRAGRRGLPPQYTSIGALLDSHNVVRPRLLYKPPLDPQHILRAAKKHLAGTGRRPSDRSGPIDGIEDTTWASVDLALRKGNRGFEDGSSLPRFLDANGL